MSIAIDRDVTQRNAFSINKIKRLIRQFSKGDPYPNYIIVLLKLFVYKNQPVSLLQCIDNSCLLPDLVVKM